MSWTDYSIEDRKRKGLLVGLNGGLQSGKDTAASFLIDKYGFKKLAFADELRKSLYALNPIVLCHVGPENDVLDVPEEPDFLEAKVYIKKVRVREYVDIYGWEHAKRRIPEVRRLLQNLGTESGRKVHGENCWVDIVKKEIKASPTQNFVVTDVRFPNELQMIHELGGHSAQLSREGYEPKGQHASEVPLEGVQYVLDNNGTLEELEKQVDDLYEIISTVSGRG